ncbi:Ig-like domain-containing protein [Patescibacteria group bacterium]|nr:Ig-like domain-containing protein [Patescibacteria group bacterium]
MKKVTVSIVLLSVFLLSGCSVTNFFKGQVDKLGGGPEVTAVDPTDGANNVALDTQVSVTFNKEMDEGTLNAKGVYISYTNEDLVVYLNPFLNSQYEYNADAKKLSITPSQEFIPDQEVALVVTESVKDSDNNSLPMSSSSDSRERYKSTFRTTKVQGEAKAQDEEAAEDTTEDLSFNEQSARNEAVDFIVTKSETYKFDGKAETLAVKSVTPVGCKGCYDVVIVFISRNEGFGDRTRKEIIGGDTLHETSIRFENGEVTEATMDNEWDVLEQKEM